MKQVPIESIRQHCAQLAPDRPVVLDVREIWEVRHARLSLDEADVVHIPMGQLPSRLRELDPERPVLCLCHHGRRSLQVAHFLANQGFRHVANLAGGIDAWSLHVDPSVPRY